MRIHHGLASIPVAVNVAAVYFADRVQPMILGLPFFLAWIVAGVLVTSITMWFIYRLDYVGGDVR